jgi:uncharacterized protein (TIRG00374 family)
VGLLILYFILRHIDVDQASNSLRTASIELLALSVGLMLAAHLLRGLKWYVALRGKYGGLDIALLYFSSKALGDLSPARVGEFAPLFASKYRCGEAAALVLVDRLFEAYATLLLGVIGILLLRFRDPRIITAGVSLALAMSAVLVLLANRRFLAGMQGKFGRWPVLTKALQIMLAISQGFDSFRHLAWLLWLISIVATALGLRFFQTLFLSVGVPVSWPLAATMVCVAAIAAMVSFTPWGLGIVEAPLWWLGQLYGLPPAGMAAFYVLVRALPLCSTWLLYGGTLLFSRCWRGRQAWT